MNHRVKDALIHSVYRPSLRCYHDRVVIEIMYMLRPNLCKSSNLNAIAKCAVQ